MRNLLDFVIVVTCAAISVSAQTSIRGAQAAQARQESKQYVEDKNASLRVDKVEIAGGAVAEENSFPRTSYSYPLEDFKPGVVRVGPRTTYIKEGLSSEEVVRLLGKPTSISERKENDFVVTTYEFQRGEGRILIAEFVKGLLVRSRTESRDEPIVRADR
ncbi:MAG TPA: hypothetical protein VGO73_03305 [Pyrinomonadaceae bacterium]|jgi:hypothetical protein|nr:hypothetical protein [Pyrinomonadaceae bacterium]